MTNKDLTHQEKDELISLTKTALELACARLRTYEGLFADSADPEYWISNAYLMKQTTGWKKDFI